MKKFFIERANCWHEKQKVLVTSNLTLEANLWSFTFFGKKCTWSINYIAFQLRLFCDVFSFDPILNLRTNTYTLTHASIKHRFAVRLVRKRSLSQLLDGEESFQGLILEVRSEQGRSSAALPLFLGSSGNMKPRRFIRCQPIHYWPFFTLSIFSWSSPPKRRAS